LPARCKIALSGRGQNRKTIRKPAGMRRARTVLSVSAESSCAPTSPALRACPLARRAQGRGEESQ